MHFFLVFDTVNYASYIYIFAEMQSYEEKPFNRAPDSQ